MTIKDSVDRVGDMHPNRALRILQQSDGDIILVIVQDGYAVGEVDTGNPNDRSAQVEFCVSGGKSRNTHAALLALVEAIKRDNIERPIRARS